MAFEIDDKTKGLLKRWDSLHISRALNGFVISDGEDHDAGPDLANSVVCGEVADVQDLVEVWDEENPKT